MKHVIDELKILQPIEKWENNKLSNNILYNDRPVSKLINNYRHKEKILPITNELNTYKFRCDEFKTFHDNLHILFTGCSVTWGTALNISDTWSYKLYNKISSEIECSGYFNISDPGSSSINQIVNIFKYVKHFGKPNYIFINFPDQFRFYSYSKKIDSIVDAFYDHNSSKILDLLFYQYYFMLEEYCRQNNIKLYSFTWAIKGHIFEDDILNKYDIEKYPLEKFKSFYKTDIKEMHNFIFNYIENNKGIDNLEYASDNEHFGIAYHEYWTDFMYRKYLEDK